MIVSEKPLQKLALVDIEADYTADFFYTEEIVEKYVNFGNFILHEWIGAKRPEINTEKLYFYK
tara:strand:- start:1008 stop:1196 length:189 start_codon:yes stop_codon:yes gene_type:complete